VPCCTPEEQAPESAAVPACRDYPSLHGFDVLYFMEVFLKATTLAFSLVLFALPLHMQAQNAFMSHSFSSFSASAMPSSSDKSWKDMKEV